MAETVHVYTTGHQEAADFTVDLWGDHEPLRITRAPRELVTAYCCDQRRWAGNCTVQVYYDGTYYWCKPGKGCKR